MRQHSFPIYRITQFFKCNIYTILFSDKGDINKSKDISSLILVYNLNNNLPTLFSDLSLSSFFHLERQERSALYMIGLIQGYSRLIRDVIKKIYINLSTIPAYNFSAINMHN